MVTSTNNKFLLRVGAKIWLSYLLIYSFMILQFWWGNHDWSPIKNSIHISDGFFEARYSQHMFSAFLLDGQLLPIITPLLTTLSLTILSLSIAKYFNLPSKEKDYFIFSILLASCPYTLILFYYSFIMLPLALWSCIGITSLFLDYPYINTKRFILKTFILTLILGSYPPIISFILTIFGAKKIIEFNNNKIPLKILINNSVIFIIQLILAYLFFKIIISQLTAYSYSIEQMYNTQTANISTILINIPKELINSIYIFNKSSITLGTTYSIFYTTLLFASFSIIINKAQNKLLTSLFLLLLLLTSRFVFIITPNANMAEFRIAFWGQLGIITFATITLLKSKSIFIKNLTFLFITSFIFIFIKTNIGIQKTQFLGFRAERLYHTRLFNTLTSHPNFDNNKKYSSLNVGYPQFHHRFHNKNIFTNELIGNTVLPFDLTEKLFWEQEITPLTCKKGIWDNKLWSVQDNKHLNCFIKIPKSNNIRYWIYTSDKTYPNKDSIYIDDNYIIFLLDKKELYKHRELISKKLSN